jgi:hypothetical protein
MLVRLKGESTGEGRSGGAGYLEIDFLAAAGAWRIVGRGGLRPWAARVSI